MRNAAVRRVGGFIGLFVTLISCARPASAQQPAPAQDPLAGLRSKDSLTDDDKKKIHDWLEQRINAIAAGDAAGTASALGELRTGGAGTTSAAYKEFYTATYIELARPAIKKADPGAATRLLTVLSHLREAPAYTVFVEGLKDSQVGVRMAAAIGLRELRPKLAVTGTQYFTEALHALRDAGQKETSVATLRAIYQAMNYAEAGVTPPDPKVNVQSLLELLETRAAQCDSNALKAEGADAWGLQAAGALRASLSDDERNRLAAATMRLLRYGVLRYAGGDPPLAKVRDKSGKSLVELRNATEQLIEEAEKLLTALLSLSNAPSVLKEIKKGEQSVPKIQLQEWAKIAKKSLNLELDLSDASESAEASGGDGG